MEFCEKCGGIIKIENGRAFCASCSHRIKKWPKIEAHEIINKKENVEIIDEEADNTYPLVQIDCPKCRHKKAYFWTSQTRSSDEPETKFYKCEKCKHTWR
ncbi:MAG: transcription factor S, partial [Nanoarchaeota archaeon]